MNTRTHSDMIRQGAVVCSEVLPASNKAVWLGIVVESNSALAESRECVKVLWTESKSGSSIICIEQVSNFFNGCYSVIID